MRYSLRALAGLIAIGAGIYLLSFSGQTIDVAGQSGRSWFDIIDHGIGAYFIARGLWMLTQLGDIDDLKASLGRLVELREWEVNQAYGDDEIGEANPAE